MAKSIAFAWETGTWYTLKFNASTAGGVATLRGKVWKRDQTEPAEWLLTATDESANTEGSPGLYGNATNAAILIDNVSVTSNE
jgi:hypothetical protein